LERVIEKKLPGGHKPSLTSQIAGGLPKKESFRKRGKRREADRVEAKKQVGLVKEIGPLEKTLGETYTPREIHRKSSRKEDWPMVEFRGENCF